MFNQKTSMHSAQSQYTEGSKTPFFQAKLTVNEPGDEYEQEADAVADKVMRMPDPSVHFGYGMSEFGSSIRKSDIPNPKSKPLPFSQIFRKCAACKEEDTKQIHRSESLLHPSIGLVQRQVATDPLAESVTEDSESEEELDAPLPEVPAFEVIAATTPTENSSGELSRRLSYNWRRQHLTFIESARLAADQNLRTVESTRSTSVDSGLFQPRWAIYLAAWNYQRWGDLNDIRRNLRPRSSFQRALQGEFQNINNVENPTGNQIRTIPTQTIVAMSSQVQASQPAELVIHFEGHGGGMGICGVDESAGNNCVDFNELHGIANQASDSGIHVTFILDTCNIGTLVSFSQADEIQNLREQAINLEPDRQQTFQEQADFVAALGSNIFHLGRAISYLYDNRRQLRTMQTELHTTVEEMMVNLESIEDSLLERPEFVQLGSAISSLQWEAFTLRLMLLVDNSETITRRVLNRWRREFSPFFANSDRIINDQIGVLRQMVATESAPTTPDATTETAP